MPVTESLQKGVEATIRILVVSEKMVLKETNEEIIKMMNKGDVYRLWITEI